MKPKAAITVCILLLTATCSAMANSIHSMQFKPTNFEKPIEYNVALPDGYQQNLDSRYTLLLAMHPRSFGMINGMQDWLSHNGQWPWPDTIVVSPKDYNQEYVELFKGIESADNIAPLLDYFEKSLLPEIDKQYRTNGLRMYHGFRGDGSLGLVMLLNRPDLFQAYFIASPNLANDIGTITSGAKDLLGKLDSTPRFAYITMGDHRYEKADEQSFELLQELLKQQAPKSLTWRTERLKQHYFMSQPVVNLLQGIEQFFDPLHVPLAAQSEVSTQGIEAIISYYQHLSSDKYHFDVSPMPSLLNRAEYLYSQNQKDGLESYHNIYQRFGDNLSAVGSYAQALFDAGQTEQAIEIQREALEIAITKGAWYESKHRKVLASFEQSL